MAVTETEVEIRTILANWRAPADPAQAAFVAGVEMDAERPVVAHRQGYWLICGADPWSGHTHSGCRSDGVGLARDMVRTARQMRAGVWKPPGGNPLSMESLQQAPSLQTEPPRTYEEATADFYAEEAARRSADTLDAEYSEPGLGAKLLDDYGGGADPLLTYTEGDPTDAPIEEPAPQDRFYGLDDLDRRRNLRIGDVAVKAATLMPPVDVPRLAALRNFAMGVSEGRWTDDPAMRAELEQAEALARHGHAIAAARDAKTAYLLNATRDEVEAFDTEADWP